MSELQLASLELAIYMAAENGKREEADSLIELMPESERLDLHFASCDAALAIGLSYLWIATKHSRLRLFLFLLADPATDLRRVCGIGHMPIHDIASRERIDFAFAAARALLQRDPDSADARTQDGETPLHFAVSRDNLKLAKLLLGHGVDVNAQDKHGHTPYHVATYLPVRDMLDYLGGIEELDPNPMDKEGATPLILAVSSCVFAIFESVLERLCKRCDLDFCTPKFGTALAYAMRRGRPQYARALLEAGADPRTAPSESDLAACEEVEPGFRAFFEGVLSKSTTDNITKAVSGLESE